MTLAMMIVLLGLGTWQVQRLAWKQGILSQIDHAETGAPLPLQADPSPFAKVSVTGVFLPDFTALYGAEVRTIPTGPELGARMIVPLRRDSGQIILVDRGWVPLKRTAPVDTPAGITTVTGYVRMGDRAGWFSAADDPAARRFFTLDPLAIGLSTGLPDIAPFILVVLADKPGPEPNVVTSWPDPAQNLPRPANNHLSYAITWYGLAMALAVIFAVWVRKGTSA